MPASEAYKRGKSAGLREGKKIGYTDGFEKGARRGYVDARTDILARIDRGIRSRRYLALATKDFTQEKALAILKAFRAEAEAI